MALLLGDFDAGARTTSWHPCGDKVAIGFASGVIEVLHKQEGSSKLSTLSKWKAHESSISRLAWAAAEYGDVVASCSQDGGIIVWEEVLDDGQLKWKQSAVIGDLGNSYVLDLQFGNLLSGLKLVVACADGHARIYGTSDCNALRHWQLQAQFSNATDANIMKTGFSCSQACISWKPALGSVQQPVFGLGYCSSSQHMSTTKIWEFSEAHQRWYPIAELGADNSAEGVTSISWAPNLGRSYELIAVASGRAAFVWHLEPGGAAQKAAQLDHPARVLSLDWDMSGTTLATSADDGSVRLWQAGLNGAWKQQALVVGR